MKKNITILLILAFMAPLFLSERANAEDLSVLSDYMIVGTLKTFARLYVQTLNLEKFKKKHIKSISRMSDSKFRRRYADIYNAIRDIPEDLKMQYGITEHMTKQEVIKEITQIDKKSMFQLINKIPNKTIFKFVKAYFQNHKVKSQDMDGLCKKMIQKA